MTEPAEFEPTLDVPHAWIEEITGEKYDISAPLALSYFPQMLDRFSEMGCTIAEIEADFARGYYLKKLSGRDGHYYILDSGYYKIWAHPNEGKTLRNQLVVLSKIQFQSTPSIFDNAPFSGIIIRPIQHEATASADALLACKNAYKTLAAPPPFERRTPTEQLDETLGLWRHEALAELLEVLRRQSKHAHPAHVEGKVLAFDDTTLVDENADRIVRLETAAPLKGWRAEMRVVMQFPGGRNLPTQVRDVDGQILEMDAPDGPLPKVGERAIVVQDTGFALGAHKRALKQFLDRGVLREWDDLRAVLVAPQELTLDEDITSEFDAEVINENLTAEQRRAVKGAISTPHAFFIQGPPGTGKTTVITEIVQRLVFRGERVMLLSSTHVAVDEVLRRVEAKSGVLPVRLTRNTNRVDARVQNYVYETARNALVKKVLHPREDAERLWARLKAESDTTYHQRLETLKRIEERWLAAGREPGAENAFEEEIGAALLRAANLICATTVGIANRKFADIGNVDTLIVDEASRVTEAEFLIGAVRAKRWILVGDEHQLPPHVEPQVEYLLLAMLACSMVERKRAIDLKSAVEQLAQEWHEEEKLHAFRVKSVLEIAEPLLTSKEWPDDYRKPFDEALEAMPEDDYPNHRELLRTIRYFLIQSTFERAVQSCSPQLRVRLSEQRRMIEPIARIVRTPVYKGEYRSPDKNTLIKLGLAPLVCDDFSRPVTFLNTQFRKKASNEELAGTGFVNRLEAQWIVDACEQFENELRRQRVQGQVSTSILCFYREQAKRIKAEIDQRHYQKLKFPIIDSIDRIQGQESDIVFISFCRARPPWHVLHEEFGKWLRDLRRLNVAFTRARRALVLVGHKPTLEKLGQYESFYTHLFELFDRHHDDMQIVHDFGRRRMSP